MDFIAQLLGIFVVFAILGFLERFFRQPKYHKSSQKPIDNPYFGPTRKQFTDPITPAAPKQQPSYGEWAEVTPNYMYISAQAKRDYLSSRKWQTLRSGAMERAGYKCQSCGSANNLHCHHIKYDWLSEGGARELADVAILCGICHQAVHDRLGYSRETHFPIN